MKNKQIIPAMMICLASLNLQAMASEKTEGIKTETVGAHQSSKLAADLLIHRLHEIQSMSKKDLSSSEKSQLKKEVRGIKQQLSTMEGGIYISATVLIIILLLIIIL